MAIGSVVGKVMNHGFAGSYSRQPDMIIDSIPAGDDIAFGDAIVYNASGQAINVATLIAGSGTFAATGFVGIATREVKSATDYLNQNVGGYAENELTPVMKRGRVNIKCQRGTAANNGDVYVRVAVNASYPTCVIGGFEASSDTTNSVKLTNARWGGAADANGIAELVILTQENA